MKSHDKYMAKKRKNGDIQVIYIALMPKDHDLKPWFNSVKGSAQVDKLRIMLDFCRGNKDIFDCSDK